MPFAVAPMAAGIVFWNAPLAAAFAPAIFTALYILSYLTCLEILASRRIGRRQRAARAEAYALSPFGASPHVPGE